MRANPVQFYFEDLPAGSSGECPPRRVTRDDIIAFAREFDPQPFHLDEEAAKTTFVGELIASGWQTCALAMRIMFDGMIHKSSSMGAPGVDEVRWLRPVRPGDELGARWSVLETRVSQSRPEMGLARMRVLLVNQKDEPVYEQRFSAMFGRRDAATAEPRPAPAPRAAPKDEAAVGKDGGTAAKAEAAPLPALSRPTFFPDLVIGDTYEVGSYLFTTENIIRFAKAYDPQPFHVDPEAAARSHFGGLCASGWHTGAACMRKLIDRRNVVREGLAAKGVKLPGMGSSPGFKELVWHKPVYAGDEISFASTLVAKRATASRPGWGLIFSRNTGVNQKGELVFSVVGSVFMETRGA
jgi:acyl dehydratase